jgi:hypothetical protein
MSEGQRIKAAVCLIAIWCTAAPVLAQDALTSPRPGEVAIGPVAVPQDVQGIAVELRATSFVSVKTESSGFLFALRLVADLGDLQQKIGSILDAISLPTDNCNHFGADNIVARLWGKQLAPTGAAGVLKLNGDVDVWTCAKNPILCSRVDWVVKDGPFGTKPTVPEVHTYECNSPIKNRNLNQPFEATIPFSLVVPNAQSLAIQLGQPSVNLGGQLGGVTGSLLRIAGTDINSKVKAALDQALNPNLLQRSMPNEYLKLNPQIVAAQFFDNGGRLAATVEFKASGSGEAATGVLQTLVRPKAASR